MPEPVPNKRADDSALMSLIRAIADNDVTRVKRLIDSSPSLCREFFTKGATRQNEIDFYFDKIRHYLVAGDTPLHAAAAAYNQKIAKILVKEGAEISARDRRGAEPLHYAADGVPGSRTWNPRAQSETIEFLIKSGADPNSVNVNGVSPLHRAVRQRCLSAVESLLHNGASVRLRNDAGSTPLHLAVQNTGRGGSGSEESKKLQKEIILVLLRKGANLKDKDGRGRTVTQSANCEWIRILLQSQ